MSGSVLGLLPRYINEGNIPDIASELAGFSSLFLRSKNNTRMSLTEGLKAYSSIIRIETGKASLWAGKELWDLIRTFNDIQGVDQWKLWEMKLPMKGKAHANILQ